MARTKRHHAKPRPKSERCKAKRRAKSEQHKVDGRTLKGPRCSDCGEGDGLKLHRVVLLLDGKPELKLRLCLACSALRRQSLVRPAPRPTAVLALHPHVRAQRAKVR